MKKLKQIIAIIFVCVLGFTYSVNSFARYVSRMTPDGTLYFIDPVKLKELHNIKNFQYDMTLLSWTDSVTINFTFESKIMKVPENLTIKSGNHSFICQNYSPLYIDIKNKNYEIRITSKFAVQDLKIILENEIPPVFYFTQENITESAAYKDSAWKKERKKLLDIFQLYLYSKNRT